MASVNLVILLGNLGQDPEVRYSPSGDAMCTLNLATNEKWKDKNGDQKEKVEWHRVVLFGRVAEVAGEYLKKGRAVYIEGKNQTREYEKDGQKRYVHEVVGHRIQLLGGRPDGEGGERPARASGGDYRKAREGGSTGGSTTSSERRSKESGDFDDDIPF